MVQKISQGDIFGRIGTGFGQGLADQLPKEIERNRLSSGLAQFEQDYQNLSPMQQMARLSSIPGITPQMLSSMGELAKQGNLRSAYERAAGMGEPGMRRDQPPPGYQWGQMEGRTYEEGPYDQRGGIPQEGEEAPRRIPKKSPNVDPSESGQPQIVQGNPLDEKMVPRAPWTPKERNKSNSDYIRMGFTPQESERLTAEDEQRYLAEPKAYQEQNEHFKKVRGEAREELINQLELKTQKKGDKLLGDLTGEMINNLERGLQRDLRLKPNSTLSDVANDWSNRGLELAKTKKQVETLMKTTGVESILKGDEIEKDLKTYADIFKRSGNSEEYQKMLTSKLGMSPQGAASIAYPLSKGLKSYIKSYRPIPSYNPEDFAKASKKAAIEVMKNLTPEDSLQAIAAAFNEKGEFDQRSFFDQLREDSDDLPLTDRQRRELAVGAKKNILFKWGDFLILPWVRRQR